MKKLFSFVLVWAFVVPFAMAQYDEYVGQSCTSIMVGKKASKDGSVITSHTCDGRYRTWVSIEPAADHQPGEAHLVKRGTMNTSYRTDTTGVRIVGAIPESAHTYSYVNTAYPCLNEHQLAMGETTFGGPDTLVNEKGLFTIEELQRVALQRCTTAREAIRLIGSLIAEYGYGDGGECITIADPKEVWQMEILGEGPDKIGGVWAAQRIPDDQVGVSANIPRIGRLQRHNPDYFLCSDNIEQVARQYGLWDGKGEFIFWKAFNCDYAQGKNFREREFFILNALAPSWNLSMDMEELPFSVKPDKNVDVRQVIELFRATYEGTDMDMTRNVKAPVRRKAQDGSIVSDTVVSPVANPWLGTNMQNTLNLLAPGTVKFYRTVSVAWCSYSHIIQLRDWLPDAVGGVCWFSVDNPAQSPRIPIFCGTTRLPKAFSLCGQKKYDDNALIWQFRKANKLATVAWQRTKDSFMKKVKELDDKAFMGLPTLEKKLKDATDTGIISEELNSYTANHYQIASSAWLDLEHQLWHQFGMGF